MHLVNMECTWLITMSVWWYSTPWFACGTQALCRTHWLWLLKYMWIHVLAAFSKERKQTKQNNPGENGWQNRVQNHCQSLTINIKFFSPDCHVFHLSTNKEEWITMHNKDLLAWIRNGKVLNMSKNAVTAYLIFINEMEFYFVWAF